MMVNHDNLFQFYLFLKFFKKLCVIVNNILLCIQKKLNYKLGTNLKKQIQKYACIHITQKIYKLCI